MANSHEVASVFGGFIQLLRSKVEPKSLGIELNGTHCVLEEIRVLLIGKRRVGELGHPVRSIG